MAKTWCSNCGNCITFNDSFKRPNFCNNCGESLGSVRKVESNSNSDLEEDEEEDDTPLPKKHISLVIEGLEKNDITFGQLYKRTGGEHKVKKLGVRTSLKTLRKKCKSADPIEINGGF